MFLCMQRYWCVQPQLTNLFRADHKTACRQYHIVRPDKSSISCPCHGFCKCNFVAKTIWNFRFWTICIVLRDPEEKRVAWWTWKVYIHTVSLSSLLRPVTWYQWTIWGWEDPCIDKHLMWWWSVRVQKHGWCHRNLAFLWFVQHGRDFKIVCDFVLSKWKQAY